MKTLDIYFALASFSCSSPEDPDEIATTPASFSCSSPEDPEKISMALTSAPVNKFP